MNWQILVSACLLVSGCVALNADEPPDRNIEVAVVSGGLQCGGPTEAPRAEWISQPEASMLPSRSTLPAAPSYTWDPAVEGALLIHMGTRPTGGYSIELAAPTAKVNKGIATIHINWIEPEPGSFVTQALTAPCLLLKIPKQGIEKIVIKDQHQHLRFVVRPGSEEGK